MTGTLLPVRNDFLHRGQHELRVIFQIQLAAPRVKSPHGHRRNAPRFGLSISLGRFLTRGARAGFGDYTEFVLPAVQEIISGLGNKGAGHLLHQGFASSSARGGARRANVLRRGLAHSLAEVRKMAGRAWPCRGNLDPPILLPPRKNSPATT